MEIKLLHHTPLEIADIAICKCYGNNPHTDKEKAQARINRVANVSKHASTIEHLYYNFDIDGISRAVLQQLCRHRVASYTVKSTRYTLQELKKEEAFCSYRTLVDGQFEIYGTDTQKERASKYLVLSGVDSTDIKSISGLELLRQELISGTPNDVAKYCMPESYKTSLTMSINMRSLQSMLELRLDKHAIWEFNDLCVGLIQALPKDHLFLVEEIVKDKMSGNKRITELESLFN